jgi:hypothetical protein
MSKSLSTSSFDMKVFMRKTGVFISIILITNAFLLLVVLFLSKKPIPVVIKAPSPEVSIFGASNVEYDLDTVRLHDAQLISVSEPNGFFLAMDLAEQKSNGKTLLADIPYSWYVPEKYAPATERFYSHITPQLYQKMIRKRPVLAVKNFLSTNLFNSELLLFLKSRLLQSPAPKIVADSDKSVRNDDGYYTCTNEYNRSKHFVRLTHYNENHFAFIKNELLTFGERNKVKVLSKYPELNKGNNKINNELVAAIQDHFEVINQFEEWPDSLMFDQWYHLNACGREINTTDVRNSLIQRGVLAKD